MSALRTYKHRLPGKSILHKRCLIPANGFIEWQEIEGTKNSPGIFTNQIMKFSPLLEFGISFPDKVTGKLELCAFVITTEANSKCERFIIKVEINFASP